MATEHVGRSLTGAAQALWQLPILLLSPCCLLLLRSSKHDKLCQPSSMSPGTSKQDVQECHLERMDERGLPEDPDLDD